MFICPWAPGVDDPAPRHPVAEQLALAQKRAQRCQDQWQRYKFRVVSDDEIRAAKERAADAHDRIPPDEDAHSREIKRLVWLCKFKRFFARLFGLETISWFPVGLLTATAAFVAIIPLLLLFRASPGTLFIIAGGVFVMALCITLPPLFVLDRSGYGDRLDDLKQWLKARRELIDVAQADHRAAKDDLDGLRSIRQLEEDYEEANREVNRLQALLADRRFQLEHTDWRSLRDVPFENFLAEVFRELGYTVRTTKKSGDQGVDLIVTGKGECIAVQVKGYSGSVGNEAVQQAFAGMAFYHCQRCIVITNSTFTASARQLAQSVGCLLVDGSLIPGLIQGRVL